MTTKLQNGFGSASSAAATIPEIVSDLTARIPTDTTRLLSVFFSARHPANDLAQALKTAYPEATIIGCTTAGELSDQGFTEQGVSAIGMDDQIVKRIAVGTAQRCTTDADAIPKALKSLASELDVNLDQLDPAKYLGLVITDGTSGHEEKVMDALATAAFNITFVGGSAGDDLQFQQAFVMADGQVYTDTAVLVLLETERPFTILKTQSFRTTDTVWQVTKADTDNRIVHEFDGRPAAEVYAETLGIAKSEIGDHFMRNPIGLLVGDEPYVRSPQQPEGENSIRFYCQVTEGSRVHLLETADMVADTTRDLQRVRTELGSLSGMLVFNCILRYLDAKNRDLIGPLGQCYSIAPAAGFNTYGEQYLGHINQTATIVCFA